MQSKPGLPSGTVTFLFTDIEGSTRLLEHLEDVYADLLADQRRLMREVFEQFEGQEVDTQGDSFFVSFPRATQAVAAAVKIQRVLHAHTWPGGVEVRVRIGLHTGEPGDWAEGYFGMDVHRAARIGAVGHGGQVLLSNITAELVQDDLPEGSYLQDLGEYQLKDMPRSETLWQLSVQELSGDFPALKTPAIEGEALPPNNLPEQATPFIGREAELEQLQNLIEVPAERLITILGPGGMGKTRLALEAGSRLLSDFSDGVFFVNLAPLTSHENILSTLGEALGFTFFSGSDPKAQLVEFLKEKSMLLLIDNCEHVLDGIGLLGDILAATYHICILTTTREKLNLKGERVFRVDGLHYPGFADPLTTATDGDGYSAIHLLSECLDRVNPEIEISREDQEAMARICHIVEGTPLAIEMAASWADTFSLEEIAREIETSLDFLQQELRDCDARHASMQAVFEYSWKLLGEEERSVLSRLSVFRGGFTREAAEEVAGANASLLRSLTQKSMIHPAQGRRYGMHEVVRRYTEMKLAQDADSEAETKEHHSSYYAKFLDENVIVLQTRNYRDVTNEIDNIRSAWSYAVDNLHYSSLRKMAIPLTLVFWNIGTAEEEISVFGRVVKRLREAPDGKDMDITLGYLLGPYGWSLFISGEPQVATTIFEESIQLLTELDARYEKHVTLLFYTAAELNLNYAELVTQLHEAKVFFNRVGISWIEAEVCARLSGYLRELGRIDEAEECALEAKRISTEIGSERGVALALDVLGHLALARGDSQHALELRHAAARAYREVGQVHSVARVMARIGDDLRMLNDFDGAIQAYLESYVLAEKTGYRNTLAEACLGLGYCFDAIGNKDHAFIAYHEALVESTSMQNEEVLVGVLFQFAEAHIQEGKFYEAAVILNQIKDSVYDFGGAKDNALSLFDEVTQQLSEREFEKIHAGKKNQDLFTIAKNLIPQNVSLKAISTIQKLELT